MNSIEIFRQCLFSQFSSITKQFDAQNTIISGDFFVRGTHYSKFYVNFARKQNKKSPAYVFRGIS